MQIDARELDLQATLLKLKGILASRCGVKVSIEILVKNKDYLKKIKAFASMSGCKSDIQQKDGYYIIHIHGYPCCV